MIPIYHPLTLQAINIVKIKRPGGGGGGGGGGGRWQTNFSVSSRQGLKGLLGH